MFVYSASCRGVPMTTRRVVGKRVANEQSRNNLIVDSGVRTITAFSEDKLRKKIARKLKSDGLKIRAYNDVMRNLDIVCKDTTQSVDKTIREIEMSMELGTRYIPPKIKFIRKRGRKTQQELDEQAFWLDSYDEVAS